MYNIFILSVPDGLDMGNLLKVTRAIRKLTDCGLYEAKLITGTVGPQKLELATSEFGQPFADLESAGCTVSHTQSLIDQLRHIASDSIELGEVELADDILKLIIAYKLSKK